MIKIMLRIVIRIRLHMIIITHDFHEIIHDYYYLYCLYYDYFYLIFIITVFNVIFTITL